MSTRRVWLEALGRPRVAFLLLMALAFAINVPYLFAGFAADDLIFLKILREHPLPYARWRGIWTMDGVPTFTNLWWYEPGIHAQFWRPLPSLVLEGSIRLFGEVAFPLHLLALLIHGVVAGTLYLLLRRLTEDRVLPLVAALVWVTCEDHSMAVGWIATITDLLCVLFLNLAFLAHARWLAARRSVDMVGALFATLLALMCKESAIVGPLVIILMSLYFPEGRERADVVDARWTLGRVRALLREPRAWAPWALVFVGYLAIYKGLAPAQMRNLMYADPLGQPGAYLRHMVLHLPIVLLGALTPVPPALVIFDPTLVVPLALAGAVLVVPWLLAIWKLRSRAIVPFAALTMLGALLPQLGADADSRLLYFPFETGAVLVTLPLLAIGPIAKRLDAPRAPGIVRAFGWYVLLVIVASGLPSSIMMPLTMPASLRKPEDQTKTALPEIERTGASRVLVLNTPGMFSTFYIPPIIAYSVNRPIDVRLLSSCNAIVSIERTGDSSFVLRTDRPGWLGNMFARSVRLTPKIERGAIHSRGLFTATILETTVDATDALAVRFELHAPDALLLSWDGKTFRPVTLASFPLGARVVLADTSDTFAGMM